MINRMLSITMHIFTQKVDVQLIAVNWDFLVENIRPLIDNINPPCRWNFVVVTKGYFLVPISFKPF